MTSWVPGCPQRPALRAPLVRVSSWEPGLPGRCILSRMNVLEQPRIELGSGNNKRRDFFGIDIAPGPQVDLVLDIERQPLPFRDDSVDYVSSHTFEHLTPVPVRAPEIFRVCRHQATVEIWTPYGKSNEGMLFDHLTFMTETSFKHICVELRLLLSWRLRWVPRMVQDALQSVSGNRRASG
jgi:hypothetical protein